MLAQDEPADGAPDASFDEVFSQWKSVLKDLRDLQVKFSISEESELEAIRINYRTKLKEAESQIPKLRDAGLRAFQKSPNSDRELTRFLITLAQDDIAHDRFASARKITQTMLDSACDEKVLYDLAGTAAFGMSQFDVAEKYLKEAESYGVLQTGADYLPAVADLKDAWEKERKIREAEADDNLPRVKLQTNKGDIVVELFENEAPDTVGNFVNLVEQGYYDGLTFHRVLPSFMAQSGCPEGDGTGGPGYNIYCECYKDDYRRHFAGTLSMAKAEPPNTGGSQFFLTFLPATHLDGKHTAFGRVIQGMDVLPKLKRRDPSKPEQLTIVPDRILKAEVLRKRPDKEYLPHKVQ
jgi:cyclophilin family peptidyl-prolyl cis-trans isomerase